MNDFHTALAETEDAITPIRQKAIDTFCSRNARDMYMIGVRLAGFDADELWTEIQRRRTRGAARINEPTVLEAMQTVRDRYPG